MLMCWLDLCAEDTVKLVLGRLECIEIKLCDVADVADDAAIACDVWRRDRRSLIYDGWKIL